MVQNPGKRITDYDLCILFTPAYTQVANAQKAVKGFQSTGIFPCNSDIFTEEDFAPATVTEQSLSDVSLQAIDSQHQLPPQSDSRNIIQEPTQTQKCDGPNRPTKPSNRIPVSAIRPLPKVESLGPRKRKEETSVIRNVCKKLLRKKMMLCYKKNVKKNLEKQIQKVG
jgi:hypothetical protein